jgi:hypothetical protein
MEPNQQVEADCRAAGIDDAQQAPYLHALGVLAQSKMLVAGENR